MEDRNWNTADDNDFEAMLKGSLSELPPDDIVTEVTPWRKSMNRVLVGMALTSIQLNFLCLNYLLPAIGIILLLLGFRTLRKENKWFKTCFIISVARTIYLIPTLILNTFLFSGDVYTAPIEPFITVVSTLLVLAEYICLWRGFIAIQEKAGLPPHAGAALALVVWYTLIFLLALLQYSGVIIFGIIVVGYICIIYNLYKLSKELDEAGYVIQTAPLKMTDRNLVLSLVSLLLIGFLCGYTFGDKYPMEWSELSTTEHAEVEEIKAKLLALGFPEYVLNDLTAEDIAACEGATQVAVNLRRGNSAKVLFTNIAVQVPDKKKSMVVFHHFLWETNPGFYGTESIQLLPTYRTDTIGWTSSGDVTGRLLYNKEDKVFASDYYSIDALTYSSNDFFGKKQNNTDIYATFSMPYGGTQQRGYLAYSTDMIEDRPAFSSWINYTHQQFPLQYPVKEAKELRMSGGWDNITFQTDQTVLDYEFPKKDNR